jgi:hypothetical protein
VGHALLVIELFEHSSKFHPWCLHASSCGALCVFALCLIDMRGHGGGVLCLHIIPEAPVFYLWLCMSSNVLGALAVDIISGRSAASRRLMLCGPIRRGMLATFALVPTWLYMYSSSAVA